MRGKDATKVAQPGEARMGDSWLWSVSKPGGLTADEEAEWFVESECIYNTGYFCSNVYTVRRVKWFREKDECERWREEVEIIEAEAPRTATYHDKYSIAWAKIASAESDEGKKAYAWKRFNFHVCLRDQMNREWVKAQSEAQRVRDAAAVKRSVEEDIETEEKLHDKRVETAKKAAARANNNSRRRNQRVPAELALENRNDTSPGKRKRVTDDSDDDETDADDVKQLLRCSRRAKVKESPDKPAPKRKGHSTRSAMPRRSQRTRK